MVETYVRKFPRYSRKFPRYSRKFPRYLCFFFVSTRNMLQTCFQLLWEFSSGISSNFLGLPFSYLQPRLPFSYYVMERAAKACEEPENTWMTKNCDISNFQAFPIPDLQKVGFVEYNFFFLALRAPQVAMLNDQRIYQLWVVWWGWSSTFAGIPTQPSTHPSNQRRPLQGESETRWTQIFGFSGNFWLLCVWKWGYYPPKTATHKWGWVKTNYYQF